MDNVARGPAPRPRGLELRQLILDAAETILAREGSDDAVTLRAIAREVGVTAPAIYTHFPDRQQILRTVVAATFDQLAGVMATAAATEPDDPVARLLSVCHAYLDFAAQRPHHYRVLFQRHRTTQTNLHGTTHPNTDVETMIGANAFGVLLDAVRTCVQTDASNATDPVTTTNQVWIGLHGQATLQASLPWHPWPADRDQFADHTVTLLAELKRTEAR